MFLFKFVYRANKWNCFDYFHQLTQKKNQRGWYVVNLYMSILCLIVVKIFSYVVISILQNNYYPIRIGVIPKRREFLLVCVNPTDYFCICWGINGNGIKCVSKYIHELFFTVGNEWYHAWPNIWLKMSSAYIINKTII